MKKLAAVLALFTLALAAALPAQAEEFISGRAGFYFPDEGGFDTGYNFGLSYGFNLADILTETVKENPWVANVTTEIGIGVYNAEDDIRFVGDVDLTVIPLTVSVIYNHPIQGTPFEIYGGGGPGLYYAMVDTPFGDDSELEVGIHLLGGGAFNLDQQLALFAELRGDLATDDVGGGFLNFGLKYKF
jgi:hypothetical protein